MLLERLAKWHQEQAIKAWERGKTADALLHFAACLACHNALSHQRRA